MRFARRLSLQYRIAVGVVLGLVLLFSLFGFLAVRTINQSKDVALEERLALAEATARTADGLIEHGIFQMDAAAGLWALDPDDPEEFQIGMVYYVLGTFESIVRLDADGNVLWQVPAGAPPAGRRVGIVGLGGGHGVVTADLCEKEGLQVPFFTEETTRRLEKMTGLAVGRGVRNPAEMGLGMTGLYKDFADGLGIVASDDQIDFLLIQLYPEGYVRHWAGGNQMEQALDVIITAAKSLPKPLVMVIGLGYEMDIMGVTLGAHKRCLQSGLAVFSTPEAAVRAVAKLIGYYENTEPEPRELQAEASQQRRVSNMT